MPAVSLTVLCLSLTHGTGFYGHVFLKTFRSLLDRTSYIRRNFRSTGLFRSHSRRPNNEEPQVAHFSREEGRVLPLSLKRGVQS